MKAADVVGRKIVAIHQNRFWNEHLDRFEWDLTYIDLEGGRRIIFNAIETQEMPAITASVIRTT